MSDFELGDRVIVKKALHREKDWDDQKRVTRKRWIPYAASGEAVVTGLRTYSDGHVEWIMEGDGYFGATPVGSEWRASRYFQAYLVVFNLREKPVVVLAEDMEKVS